MDCVWNTNAKASFVKCFGMRAAKERWCMWWFIAGDRVNVLSGTRLRVSGELKPDTEWRINEVCCVMWAFKAESCRIQQQQQIDAHCYASILSCTVSQLFSALRRGAEHDAGCAHGVGAFQRRAACSWHRVSSLFYPFITTHLFDGCRVRELLSRGMGRGLCTTHLSHKKMQKKYILQRKLLSGLHWSHRGGGVVGITLNLSRHLWSTNTPPINTFLWILSSQKTFALHASIQECRLEHLLYPVRSQLYVHIYNITHRGN